MLLSPEVVERELRRETRKVSDALHFLAAAIQAADVAPAVERELRDMAGHIRNVGLDEAIRELERTRRVVRPRAQSAGKSPCQNGGQQP